MYLNNETKVQAYLLCTWQHESEIELNGDVWYNEYHPLFLNIESLLYHYSTDHNFYQVHNDSIIMKVNVHIEEMFYDPRSRHITNLEIIKEFKTKEEFKQYARERL